MNTTPTTATVYTNQWVRITGRMRPTYYLLAVAAFSLLLGAAVLLANQDAMVAIEAALISLALTSALAILIWRRGDATEINLGAEQVRSGRKSFAFGEIAELDLHHSGNLYVSTKNARVLLPLPWLAHDQLKVTERMVRLLDAAKLPEGQAASITEHLKSLLEG